MVQLNEKKKKKMMMRFSRAMSSFSVCLSDSFLRSTFESVIVKIIDEYLFFFYFKDFLKCRNKFSIVFVLWKHFY